MAINYKLIQRKDPSNKEEQPEQRKWYAVTKINSQITAQTVAQNVAARSGHSVGQVLGLLTDFMTRAAVYIQMGKTVEMKPIGNLTLSMHNDAADTEEAYDVKKNLHCLKIYLRDSGRTREELKLTNTKLEFFNIENKILEQV